MPSGARPGNMFESHRQPRLRSPSLRGTRKPKPSGGPPTAEASKPSATTASPADGIASSASPSVRSIPLSRGAALGDGVATNTASASSLSPAAVTIFHRGAQAEDCPPAPTDDPANDGSMVVTLLSNRIASPSSAPKRSMRTSSPRLNEVSVPLGPAGPPEQVISSILSPRWVSSRTRRLAVRRSRIRDTIAQTRLPCASSMAAIFGNVLARLSFRVSPAKTPETIASIRTSAASDPIRRLANSWIVSSIPSGLERANGSRKARSRPGTLSTELDRRPSGPVGSKCS